MIRWQHGSRLLRDWCSRVHCHRSRDGLRLLLLQQMPRRLTKLLLNMVENAPPFPSAERQLLHHRSIALRFFERPDGLFEVEGALMDRKSHPFRRQLAEEDTPAGHPLHDSSPTSVCRELFGDRAVTHRDEGLS